MRVRCSFCGSAETAFRGREGAVCGECLERMAAERGWAPAPPAPLGAEVLAAVKSFLEGLPGLSLGYLGLVHHAVLELSGPIESSELADAVAKVEAALTGVVSVRGVPPASMGAAWLDTPAGALLLPVPGEGRPGSLVEMLPGLLEYWSRLPGSYRDLERLAHGDTAFRADEPLVEAVRRVVQGGSGDWPEAVRCLQRVPPHHPDRALARFNLARLHLLLGRPDEAARDLEETLLFDARELRGALTTDLFRLGECRQNLKRLAFALDLCRESRGAPPSSLEELVPSFLTVVPTCGGEPYEFEPVLRCRHARWDPAWGVVVRDEEVPAGFEPEGRPGGSVLETLASRRVTRGLWVSAGREVCGDLPGAALALEGLAGAEASLHRVLLALRRGRPAGEDLRELLAMPRFSLPESALLRDRVAAVADPPVGLVLLLSRLGLPCAPPRDERAAFLASSGFPAQGTLVQGLELAYDHQAPSAALVLERLAIVQPKDAAWILLILSRLYRLAGLREAARSAALEARERGARRHEVDLDLVLSTADQDLRKTLLELSARWYPLATAVAWELLREGCPTVFDPDGEPAVGVKDGAVVITGAGRLPALQRAVAVAALERQGRVEEALAMVAGLRDEHPGWPTPYLLEARLRESDEPLRELLAVRPSFVPALQRVDPARAAELWPDAPELDLHLLEWPDPFWGMPAKSLELPQAPP